MIILDRISKSKAAIEIDGIIKWIDVDRVDASEGDVLVECEDGTFKKDISATKDRAERIKSKFDSLF